MHYTLSPVSLEEIKLISIVNWIYPVPDFLRLFMISFKYSLNSWRCSLIDRALFVIIITFMFNIIIAIKITFSYWFVVVCFYKIYLILLVCNNLLLLFKKVFDISNYSVFWFSWFLSTSTRIVGTCWFAISLGCICFKKTHNVFNTTYLF